MNKRQLDENGIITDENLSVSLKSVYAKLVEETTCHVFKPVHFFIKIHRRLL